MKPSHAFQYHLLAAWSAWFGGRLLGTDTLLGLSIRWWGRAGAAAEFVATLLLVWDGADSIWFRRFALWLQATKRWGETPGNQTSPPVRGAWFATYALVSGAAFMAWFLLVGLAWATPAGPWLDDLSSKSHRNYVFLCVGFSLLWAGCFWAIFRALWRLVGWLAEVPSFPHRLKAPAILLLVVGFHFVLLAL